MPNFDSRKHNDNLLNPIHVFLKVEPSHQVHPIKRSTRTRISIHQFDCRQNDFVLHRTKYRLRLLENYRHRGKNGEEIKKIEYQEEEKRRGTKQI